MKTRTLYCFLSFIFCLSILFSSPAPAAVSVIGTADYAGTTCQLVWEENNNGKSLVWLDFSHKPDNYPAILSWAASLETSLTIHINPPYQVTWIDPTWRLPETADDGRGTTGCDGSTSAGWNITSSEMGHLFYSTLGNKGFKDSSCKQQMRTHNFAPFKNLVTNEYWSGTISISHEDWLWGFNFNSGEQTIIPGGGYYLHGLAVRTARVTTGEVTCPSRHLYYMPYFASGDGRWTGLGLGNTSSSETADVCISVFADNGEQLSRDRRIIQPNGQASFPVSGGSLAAVGWIEIHSSAPLSGLSFIGTANGVIGIMADIPVSDRTAEKLVIPQVAHDKTWETKIFIANPNETKVTVKLAYITPAGETPYKWKSYRIEKKCSRQIEVAELLEQHQVLSGKVEIRATGGGIVAFALYNDLKSGGHYFAGVNAEIPTDSAR